MFSSRIPWDAPQNRLSQLLAAKRACGARLLDLSETNPTRVGLARDPALLLPLSDPGGLAYEPTPVGLLAARQAVADHYRARGASMVAPERLVLCASTSEAYAWLFQLLCDVGDVVLHPEPSYPLLQHLAGLTSVRLQPYPLVYERWEGWEGRWRIDVDGLLAACEARTRAIVVIHPNNPTGSCLLPDELAALRGLCMERGLCLISDEVFGDYMFPDAPAERVGTLCGEGDVLTFVLSGLSKVLGLPQLKLGWIHVGGPDPLRTAAHERLLHIADTFLSVGTPVMRAAPALLKQAPRLHGPILQRVVENRERLRRLLAGSALQVLGTDGGWSAVVRLPRLLGEEEWVLLLLQEDNVVSYPGYFFDFPEEAYIVLSLLPEPEVLVEGVERIVSRVERV